MAENDTAFENAIYALGELYLEKRMLENAVDVKDTQLRAVEEVAIHHENRVSELETLLSDSQSVISSLEKRLARKKGRS